MRPDASLPLIQYSLLRMVWPKCPPPPPPPPPHTHTPALMVCSLVDNACVPDKDTQWTRVQVRPGSSANVSWAFSHCQSWCSCIVWVRWLNEPTPGNIPRAFTGENKILPPFLSRSVYSFPFFRSSPRLSIMSSNTWSNVLSSHLCGVPEMRFFDRAENPELLGSPFKAWSSAT